MRFLIGFFAGLALGFGLTSVMMGDADQPGLVA